MQVADRTRRRRAPTAAAATRPSSTHVRVPGGVCSPPPGRVPPTPRRSARPPGHESVARLLLERGADAIQAESDGWTALMLACQNGHVDAARLLLDKGAAVDRAKEGGDTPLSIAKNKGHSAVVALLKKWGARESGGCMVC